MNENVEHNSPMFNILDGRKMNSHRFTSLSLMSTYLFAINLTMVALKSVFSISRRVLDPFRSPLAPKTVERLEISFGVIQVTNSILNNIEKKKYNKLIKMVVYRYLF